MNKTKEITEPLTFVGPVSPAIAHDIVNGMMDSASLAQVLHSFLTGHSTARELSYAIQICAETELQRLGRRDPDEDDCVEDIS